MDTFLSTEHSSLVGLNPVESSFSERKHTTADSLLLRATRMRPTAQERFTRRAPSQLLIDTFGLLEIPRELQGRATEQSYTWARTVLLSTLQKHTITPRLHPLLQTLPRKRPRRSRSSVLSGLNLRGRVTTAFQCRTRFPFLRLGDAQPLDSSIRYLYRESHDS